MPAKRIPKPLPIQSRIGRAFRRRVSTTLSNLGIALVEAGQMDADLTSSTAKAAVSNMMHGNRHMTVSDLSVMLDELDEAERAVVLGELVGEWGFRIELARDVDEDATEVARKLLLKSLELDREIAEALSDGEIDANEREALLKSLDQQDALSDRLRRARVS